MAKQTKPRTPAKSATTQKTTATKADTPEKSADTAAPKAVVDDAKTPSTNIPETKAPAASSPATSTANDSKSVSPPSADTAKADSQAAAHTAAKTTTTPDSKSATDSAPKTDAASKEAPASKTTPPASAHQAAQAEAKAPRRGGAMPLIFGGILAGAIGYGAATYLPQYVTLPGALAPKGAADPEMTAKLTDLSDKLSGLTSKVEGMGSASGELKPQVDALDGKLTNTTTALDGVSKRLDEAFAKLDALGTRMDELQNATPTAPKLSEEDMASIRKSLSDDLSTLRTQVETLANEAQTRADAAEEAETKNARRAALAIISTAIDTGDTYKDAVAALEATGQQVSQDLMGGAETGVATLSTLQQEFPDLAREALAKARAMTEESTGTDGANAGEAKSGGLGSFFRSQFAVRSLEPREGNDPDAVLSRAEAALNNGDLETTLKELDALPEEARAILADWMSAAQTRMRAAAAARKLTTSLN